MRTTKRTVTVDLLEQSWAEAVRRAGAGMMLLTVRSPAGICGVHASLGGSLVFLEADGEGWTRAGLEGDTIVSDPQTERYWVAGSLGTDVRSLTVVCDGQPTAPSFGEGAWVIIGTGRPRSIKVRRAFGGAIPDSEVELELPE